MAEQIKINPEQAPSPSTIGADAERLSTPEIPSPSEGSIRPESHQAAVIPSPGQSVSTAASTNTVDAQRIADIEHILEEDLSEIYFKLPETEKVKFRTTGEKTAREINTLLSAAHIKLKKIIEAITDWLKLIPGVSAFFLEQEAKIKADRLLKLNNRR
jgi:hypothetical protein